MSFEISTDCNVLRQIMTKQTLRQPKFHHGNRFDIKKFEKDICDTFLLLLVYLLTILFCFINETLQCLHQFFYINIYTHTYVYLYIYINTRYIYYTSMRERFVKIEIEPNFKCLIIESIFCDISAQKYICIYIYIYIYIKSCRINVSIT